MTGFSGASAGFARRLAALIYDAVLLIALVMTYTAVVLLFTHRAVLATDYAVGVYAYRAGLLGVIGGYYALNWTRSGQTLGMRAWRLRALGDTLQPMTARAALMRCLCGALAWPPAGLGVLWLYLDPDHLAIHDRLSRTRVVVLAKA